MPTADAERNATPAEELGQLLAAFRAERGLAQKQAAQLADIDGSTLSRLEKGERGVSREVLERVSAVLQLNRRQHVRVLELAGFLTEEAARFLADERLSSLAELLTNTVTDPDDLAVLRQHVELAIAYAVARGYPVSNSRKER